jgi:dTDP-4-amino-4,6-dideoxygalactose transaminase
MDFIPLIKPWITEEDISAVNDVMRRGEIGGDGPQCRELEKLLEERFGVPRALLTTSCTSALELAMMAAGIGPGDEVILPSYTFASTATCVVQRFARPVLADVEPDTFNLDADLLEPLITDRTRAIMVMHYSAHACRMDEINTLAAKYNLLVVEDAAHTIDAYYKGRELGAVGDLGALSFHYTKNLVAGEGGALLCRQEAHALPAEIAREKGTNRASFLRGEVNKYGWVAPGSSYVISNILGALALSQYQRLPEITAGRKRAAEYYLRELADCTEFALPVVHDYAQVNWHMFVLRVPRALRNDLQSALKQHGVGATSHYLPLHTSPYGMSLGYKVGDLPVSEEAAETCLRLPLYPQLTEEELAHVVCAVKESLVELR